MLPIVAAVFDRFHHLQEKGTTATRTSEATFRPKLNTVFHFNVDEVYHRYDRP